MTPGIEPWYRQFWPWFIIALLASSVIGSFTSAYLALRYPETIYDRTDDPATPPRPPAHSDG